ncbi:MAG: hypothetical protein EYC70_07825 [Planctomycetota bacterium]|nr:MAG: hypothetical protein EYC70_07825 [Planctomycetota bacterium]
MRGLARLLILLGGLLCVGGVALGFALNLRSLHLSFGWPGAAAGVLLAPLTLMVEPWRALLSAHHIWWNLAACFGGVLLGSALYGFGHLLAHRVVTRDAAAQAFDRNP